MTNAYFDQNIDPNASQNGFNEFSTDRIDQNFGDIAMTRGQARGIVDKLTREAIRKNITPDRYVEGLWYLNEAARSPDFTRSQIRNILKTPGASMVIDNPNLAKEFLSNFSDKLQGSGVNPETLRNYSGTAIDMMQQLKRDNLLRPNVTRAEVEREVQEPMYGALQDWLKQNRGNPAIGDILKRSTFGSNLGGAAKTKGDLAPLLLRDVSGYGMR